MVRAINQTTGIIYHWALSVVFCSTEILSFDTIHVTIRHHCCLKPAFHTMHYISWSTKIMDCQHQPILTTVYSKTFKLENFCGFRGFQQVAKVFPLNPLAMYSTWRPCLMHRESFPVNSAFCAQPQKFSHSKVLPYTVCYQTLFPAHANKNGKKRSGNARLHYLFMSA